MEDRREEERRLNPPKSLLARRWKTGSLILVGILASLLTWKWRYVYYAPIWAGRALWGDRSDIYLGKTNGVSNLQLAQQSRTYLSDVDHVDASGNFTSPEILRAADVRLDTSWFMRHPPEAVDFNPFISSDTGHYVVSWTYVPGCQRRVGKYSSGPDWYDLEGQPCPGVCRVSVIMAPNLKLTGIKLDPIRF